MKKTAEIESWVARDADNSLWLYFNYYPVLMQGDKIYDSIAKDRVKIPNELFPILKHIDGPQKVKLILK